MAYSVDFRKCVLENLESGKTWDEVVSIFSISRDTPKSLGKLIQRERIFRGLPTCAL